MNDDLFKILATVLGTIITVGLGYLISKVGKVEASQLAQAISFAEMKGVVNGLKDSISNLHKWSSSQQERELESLHRQIRELKGITE